MLWLCKKRRFIRGIYPRDLSEGFFRGIYPRDLSDVYLSDVHLSDSDLSADFPQPLGLNSVLALLFKNNLFSPEFRGHF